MHLNSTFLNDRFLNLAMSAKGTLAAVYAHMVSLMNWQRVIQRTMRRLSTETAS